MAGQAKVPSSIEGEDFNLHAQGLSQLRQPAFPCIDFPKKSGSRMTFFTEDVVHKGMELVELSLRRVEIKVFHRFTGLVDASKLLIKLKVEAWFHVQLI